jgi:hypothetical protein
MRPRILSDEAIRTAVADLRAAGERVTGLKLRNLLAARFGARGGVERIYRILDELNGPDRAALPRPAPVVPPPSDESREAAIARADLAEHRELAHQERWARETDALRTRLAAAEQAARDVEYAARRVAELSRALATAQARIAALEQILRERG